MAWFPTIYNPSTGAPFPGNVIPSSLDSTRRAAGLLQYIPLPNLPGTVQNFDFVTAVPADTDNVSLRLNQNLGKNDRLALTESFQRRKSDTAQLFGYLDPGNGFGDNTDLSWTHNVGSNALNIAHTDVQPQSHHAGFLFLIRNQRSSRTRHPRDFAGADQLWAAHALFHQLCQPHRRASVAVGGAIAWLKAIPIAG